MIGKHKKVKASGGAKPGGKNKLNKSPYSRSPFLEGAISAFDLFGVSSTFKVDALPLNKPESQKQTILRNFAEASKYLNESFRLFEVHAGNKKS
jgi:hypothetical protein